jgi:hypothetical protein
MKQLLDTVWQRRGISWLWDDEALSKIAAPGEVLSLRQLLRSDGHWPDDPPSNNGRSVVVAGLDAYLDLVSPNEADAWLSGELKHVILSFQDGYQGDVALIFWLPGGQRRIRIETASDAVTWRCGAPHGDCEVDFGRLLWGEAREYPKQIVLTEGTRPSGLFHLRIT